jgi:hypothetical protein
MEYFEYIEVFSEAAFNDNILLLSNTAPEELLLLRLFNGTVDIKHLLSNKVFKPRINYSTFPYKRIRKSRSIIENTLNDGLRFQDLSEYLRYSRRKHKGFYKPIRHEITNYLYQKYRKSHTLCFIYLFSLLEGISYGFPLIYSSKTNDFKKSYKSLQKYFLRKENDGELAFFKRFVNEMFTRENYLTLSIDINIQGNNLNLELQQKYYRAIKKICNESDISDEDAPRKISLKFATFGDFIMNLRNRYFHYQRGGWQENLSSLEVVDPDSFFSIVNDSILNWIAIIYFEILNYSIINRVY